MDEFLMFIGVAAALFVGLHFRFNWKRYRVRRGLKTVPEAFIGDTEGLDGCNLLTLQKELH